MSLSSRCGLICDRSHSVSSRLLVVVVIWFVAMEEGGGWRRKPGGVFAQQFDGCVFETEGGVIDLSSLANTDGTARFAHVAGAFGSSPWYYSYNPCFPFSDGTCSNAAVCQTDETRSVYYDCGYTSTAELSTDSGMTAIRYTASTEIDRVSHVALNCDPSATEPELEAIGDTGQGDYHFVLTSVCACPNGCSGGSGEAEITLSIGSVLLIILLAVTVVYVLGGVVYNRARHQRTGVELCPNLSFWRSLPATIKDGFSFTCSKVRGGSSVGSTYQSV